MLKYRMRKRYSTQQKEEWYKILRRSMDFDDGVTMFDLCQRNGIPYDVMYRYCLKNGLMTFTTKTNGKSRKFKDYCYNEKRKLKDEDLDEVKRLYYEEVKSYKIIAEIYGCSVATVSHFFKKHNLIPRSRTEISTKIMRTDEYREIMRKHSTENYLKRRKVDTKPEREFKEWLNERGVEYVEQYRKVGNAHPYDFLLPKYNLLVEIDGHYWHSLPHQIKKDREQVDFAIARGYNIVRIDTEELKDSSGDYNKWLKIM